MGRHKVAPEQRQRIERACTSCKRRRQKCSGGLPCRLCTNKQLECRYDPRMQQQQQQQHATENEGGWVGVALRESPVRNGEELSSDHGDADGISQHPTDCRVGTPSHVLRTDGAVVYELYPFASDRGDFPRPTGGGETQAEDDETRETIIHKSSVMLTDPNGRLCKESRILALVLNLSGRYTQTPVAAVYVGDSASLSFLQALRNLARRHFGSSDFTNDALRSKIVESGLKNVANPPVTHVLPNRSIADRLIESFFQHTNGLICVFRDDSFSLNVDRTYRDTLSAQSSWLCLLNLVLAIGLQLHSPDPVLNPAAGVAYYDSNDSPAVERFYHFSADRSEHFFFASKRMIDRTLGIEDGGLWLVQALILMAVYMMGASKSNAAFSYLGMATRSAQSLGLYRGETYEFIDDINERNLRRNIWRSIYVLDSYLAASLGRPRGITDEDCSVMDKHSQMPEGQWNMASLNASVGIARIIGSTLELVYCKRRISTSVADCLSKSLRDWSQGLPQDLKNFDTVDHISGEPSRCFLAAKAMHPSFHLGSLHVYLSYFHAVTLLTRPFLLYETCVLLQRQGQKTGHEAYRIILTPSMRQYAKGCVESALESLGTMASFLKKNTVPLRDAFAIYCVFTSALVVLCQSFVFDEPKSQNEGALDIALKFLARSTIADLQARRYHQILTSLRSAVHSHQERRSALSSRRGQDVFRQLFGFSQVENPPLNLRDLSTSSSTATDTIFSTAATTEKSKSQSSIDTASNGPDSCSVPALTNVAIAPPASGAPPASCLTPYLSGYEFDLDRDGQGVLDFDYILAMGAATADLESVESLNRASGPDNDFDASHLFSVMDNASEYLD